MEPDRGTLPVSGHDVVRDPMAVRRMIGLAGQSAAVEEMMTGRENLVMVARLYGQGRNEAVASAERILEQMDLVDAADRRVKTYSGACAGGSTSGPASWAVPVCCCSTSRRRDSTRAAATRCGTAFAR